MDRQDVAIYYPLAVPTTVFHDAAHRTAFKAQLQSIPIEGIWLRIHPFGSDSGHVTLQRHILACWDLHSMSLPLIAEKTGSIGLALLAFGAVGGIESGVSTGEKFDYSRLNRSPKAEKGFSPAARVYIPALGMFLDRQAAQQFFENRTLRANFACPNTAYCRRGPEDMVGNPRRHFVYTRMEEVGLIGQAPPQLRATQYLERVLRPATDRVGRALQAELDRPIRVRLERERRKLDGWRHTLGEMSRTRPALTFSATPQRRVLRRRGA